MKFREQLPENCPPDSAVEIRETIYVFRLVRSLPPTESDFQSQRAENLDRSFSGVSECQAFGLSVFLLRSDAEKKLKLPKMRGRKVCRVMLVAGAGYIDKTGRASHHTWWPLAKYDILAQCNWEAI
ncbi:MAG: hypothetical protein OXF66_04780 [Gammaproteobacteria bacterium]|nr:hypothetical protein [Gammaproteobacteria bacterium]MCY4255091.1 hypothetical protein [Gammaproteobacteria bacterium]